MKKILTYNVLLRVGLGVIFLANSLMAFLAPAEFVDLINNSFVAAFLPIRPETFVPLVIGINDGTVALLLFFGIATRRVGLWATLWLIGVMIVIGVGSPFDVLEHAGLLFMSAALVLGDKYLTKNI